jgi:CHASE2 domain-containing sensor protein
VGKARILRHDAVEIRLRWAGAILLLLVVAAAAFLSYRYYGLRAGWWSTLAPMAEVNAATQAVSTRAHAVMDRVIAWWDR